MGFNSELLRKLCNAYGPSGREYEIRQIIIGELSQYVDKIECDGLGNIIAYKKGEGKKIAISAHMDQIGLMLRSVDEKGRYRILPIGSVKPYNMIDTRVKTRDGCQGVVMCEKKMPGEAVTSDDLYVEFGKRLSADFGGLKGQEVVIKSEYYEDEEYIISGALDDRIGCMILLEAVKKLKYCSNEIYMVFSVQEENGFRGIQSAVSSIQPDVLISVDVTCVNEELRGMKTDIELGKGIALKVMDHFMIVDQEVIDWQQAIAKENQVPYQLDISDHGGTDSCKVQENMGIKAGAICIPAKNIHSGNEIVSKTDVENGLKMIMMLLESQVKI